MELIKKSLIFFFVGFSFYGIDIPHNWLYSAMTAWLWTYYYNDFIRDLYYGIPLNWDMGRAKMSSAGLSDREADILINTIQSENDRRRTSQYDGSVGNGYQPTHDDLGAPPGVRSDNDLLNEVEEMYLLSLGVPSTSNRVPFTDIYDPELWRKTGLDDALTDLSDAIMNLKDKNKS